MANGDVYTALMSIPGADRALDFLQRQAAGYAYVPTRLESIRRGLEGIRAAAAARNDTATVGKVAATLSGLPKVQSLYASTSGKVAELMTALRVGTSGSALALVPKLLATVAEMALVFKSVDMFERAVVDLGKGTVTPEELAQLRRGGFTPAVAANTALRWALLLGGVWLGLQLLKRR